jgi:hypothetical protein
VFHDSPFGEVVIWIKEEWAEGRHPLTRPTKDKKKKTTQYITGVEITATTKK